MPGSNRPTHDSEFGGNVEDLVRRIRERDKDAEKLLYDRHVRRLIGLVRSNLDPIYGPRFSAESVVQSTMASFFIRLRKGEYDLGESGQFWRLLAAIAMNKLRERKRFHGQDKRDVRRDEREELGLFGSVDGIPLEELAAEPDDEEMRALRDGVQEVLEAYSARERFIITLSLQVYSVKEVVKQAQTSDSNARKVLKDFKEELADRLKSSFAETGGEARKL
jgi:RNA polymerase sigma factor (sigma-70 family)